MNGSIILGADSLDGGGGAALGRRGFSFFVFSELEAIAA